MSQRDCLIAGGLAVVLYLLFRKGERGQAADVVADRPTATGPDQGSGIMAPGEAGAAERERFSTFRDGERTPATLGAEGAAWAGMSPGDAEYIVGASGVQ